LKIIKIMKENGFRFADDKENGVLMTMIEKQGTLFSYSDIITILKGRVYT